MAHVAIENIHELILIHPRKVPTKKKKRVKLRQPMATSSSFCEVNTQALNPHPHPSFHHTYGDGNVIWPKGQWC